MSDHRGSCLCGAVEYKISGAFENFYLCHCKYCRKGTGSAHAANLFSSEAELIWLKGVEAVKRYRHKDTDHVKGFCSRCGAALPTLQMDGKLVVVPAGSLDTRMDLRPDGHIFYSVKAAWDKDLETLAKHAGFPGAKDEWTQ